MDESLDSMPGAAGANAGSQGRRDKGQAGAPTVIPNTQEEAGDAESKDTAPAPRKRRRRIVDEDGDGDGGNGDGDGAALAPGRQGGHRAPSDKIFEDSQEMAAASDGAGHSGSAGASAGAGAGGEQGARLKKLLQQGGQQLLSYVQTTLQGVFAPPAEGVAQQPRREHVAVELICACLELVEQGSVPGKLANSLVRRCMAVVENLSGRALTHICDAILGALKRDELGNGRCLDILPKVLTTVCDLDRVEVVVASAAGGHSQGGPETEAYSGTAYRDHFLNRLCAVRHEWPVSCITALTTTLREVPMTTQQLGQVIDKAQRSFASVEIEDLPVFVYQLLLLAAKGHKQLVLARIIQQLNELDISCRAGAHDGDSVASATQASQAGHRLSAKRLRPVEATLILHFTFAMKQDQDLGREFIKYLKADRNLTEFSLALALSMCPIHRFESAVLDILKSRVLASYKERRACDDSLWLRNNLQEQQSFTTLFDNTVRNSTQGIDQLTQGLVQFSFVLMDANPEATHTLSATSASPSPQQLAARLGSRILRKTFSVHEAVRSEIIDSLLNRVVSKTTKSVFQYSELLEQLVRLGPQMASAALPKLKEAFDYLAYLPPSFAKALLKAIMPLVVTNASLRDSVMLVLRKAMFIRDAGARAVAVHGFVLILKHFKVGRAKDSIGSSICLEVLANVRRCLTQQVEVRMELYKGLAEAAHQNASIRGHVKELILGQLHGSCPKAEAIPPIRMDRCVQQSDGMFVSSEPLDTLLGCALALAELSRGSPEDSACSEAGADNDATGNGCAALLTKICHGMSKSEMADFELDKSANFNPADSVGMKNLLIAETLCAVYDRLIDAAFTMADTLDIEAAGQLIALFSKRKEITSALQATKKKVGRPKGKGKAAAADGAVAESGSSHHHAAAPQRAGLHASCGIRLSTATRMLADMCCSDEEAQQPALMVLRSKPSFPRFLLDRLPEIIRQAAEESLAAGDDGFCQDAERLGAVLLAEYSCDKAKSLIKKAYDVKKEKQVDLLCLEAYGCLVEAFCSRFPEKLGSFLGHLDTVLSNSAEDTEFDEGTLDGQIHLHCRWVKREMLRAVTEDELRPTGVFLRVMTMLVNRISHESDQIGLTFDWLDKLCMDKCQNIADGPTLKALLSLLFQMSFRVEEGLDLVQALAVDMRVVMGSSEAQQDESQEEDATLKYSIVTHKFCSNGAIPVLVASAIENTLDSMDWAYRALSAAVKTHQLGTQQTSPPLFKNLCGLAQSVVSATAKAASCGIEDKHAPVFFKLIRRAYKNLTTIAKHVGMLFSKQGIAIAQQFLELVQMTHQHLSKAVYDLIYFTEGESAAGAKKSKNYAQKSKLIPSVIFAIETFERHIIQLSSQAKEPRLLRKMKRSTNRDFRIQGDVEGLLAEADDEDEEGNGQGKGKKRAGKGKQKKKGAKRRRTDGEEEEEEEEDASDEEDGGVEEGSMEL